MSPLYHAPLAQRTKSFSHGLRIEDLGIDPPHATWYDLRAGDDAALEEQAGVALADAEPPCGPGGEPSRLRSSRTRIRVQWFPVPVRQPSRLSWAAIASSCHRPAMRRTAQSPRHRYTVSCGRSTAS